VRLSPDDIKHYLTWLDLRRPREIRNIMCVAESIRTGGFLQNFCIRNWSHIATQQRHCAVFTTSSCWSNLLRLPRFNSNWIRMNFYGIVPQLQVNYTQRLTESDFPIRRHTLKMEAMTSFHAEKCCHLVSAHVASAMRIYSSVPPPKWPILCRVGR